MAKSLRNKLYILLFGVIILSACTQRLEVMRAEINDLKSESYRAEVRDREIKDSISNLNKEISAIKKELQRPDITEAIKEGQASLYMQLQGLQADMNSLRGAIEEQGITAKNDKKILSQTDEIIIAKQEGIEKSLKELQERLAKLEEDIASLKKAKESPPSPEALYEEAYSLFTAKKYPEARERFILFTKTYPEHKLIGNAYFWLGETYFVEKNYESAILSYEEVLKYKDSPKVSSAMLKQALAFIEIEDKKTAISVLKELVEKYPDSEQAPLARKKLDELSPKKK
jgi:tol-pal system protein YbgF